MRKLFGLEADNLFGRFTLNENLWAADLFDWQTPWIDPLGYNQEPLQISSLDDAVSDLNGLTTYRVSGGVSGGSDSVISADGNTVVYQDYRTSNTSGLKYPVFIIYDIAADSYDLISSRDSSERLFIDVSDDGNYISYRLGRNNDSFLGWPSDIAIYDRQSGTSENITFDITGDLFDPNFDGMSNYSFLASQISNNGQFVAIQVHEYSEFDSDYHLFLYDRNTDLVVKSIYSGYDFAEYFNLSGDGRYLTFYTSEALVGSDTNGFYDTYLYDAVTDQYEVVSIDRNGNNADADSGYSAVSDDGRYVAFLSNASDLIAGMNNLTGNQQAYVRDRQTGETILISEAIDGGFGDSISSHIAISANGRFIAFSSQSTNLIPEIDGNNAEDIFVYDMMTQSIIRASISDLGEEANSDSLIPAISNTGIVTYSSYASNLNGTDTNENVDVFISAPQYDDYGTTIGTAGTAMVNDVTSGSIGTIGDVDLLSIDISAGQALRFTLDGLGTLDTNMTLLDANGAVLATNDDLTGTDSFFSYAFGVSGTYYLRLDGQNDTMGNYNLNVTERPSMSIDVVERVSISTNGEQGNGSSYNPDISGDGRYIVFHSYTNTWFAGDDNADIDVFVYDRETDALSLVSENSIDGTVGNGRAYVPVISGDGQWVAFSSRASDMGFGGNGEYQIYLKNLDTGQLTLVSQDDLNQLGDGSSYSPRLNWDGSQIFFSGFSSNLGSNSTNGFSNIFWAENAGGNILTLEQLTLGNASSYRPEIADFDFDFTFYSGATNLGPTDTNGVNDIYFGVQPSAERISVSSSGAQANSQSYNSDLSGDGRFVVFDSYASNLVAGDTNGARDIFVMDRDSGVVEQISFAFDGQQTNGDSYDPSISNDGRFITFVSSGSNLVEFDSNGVDDVFVHDRATGDTIRISVSIEGFQANGASLFPEISADGQHITFYTEATNLVAGDTNGVRDIIVVELGTASNEYFGDSEDNEISATEFTDIIHGLDGDDVLRGSGGDDVINGNNGIDQLFGDDGADIIKGGASRDIIWGGNDADNLNGNGGNDYLNGGTGDDIMAGSSGNDELRGGSGQDILYGQAGTDRLYGGGDKDTLFIDHLDSIIDGGAGYDRAIAATGSGAIDLNMGASNIELARGSAFADDIDASTLTTFATLFGLGGQDTLIGSAQSDRLHGGDGNDDMTGGLGNDRFFFTSDWGDDVITDFGTGADRMDLRAAGITNINELSITQIGADTLIEYGSDSIRLSEVDMATINRFDFVFAPPVMDEDFGDFI